MKVFNSGYCHFFEDNITGWYHRTDKKGKTILMLRTNGGGLWDVDEDEHEEFLQWTMEKARD